MWKFLSKKYNYCSSNGALWCQRPQLKGYGCHPALMAMAAGRVRPSSSAEAGGRVSSSSSSNSGGGSYGHTHTQGGIFTQQRKCTKGQEATSNNVVVIITVVVTARKTPTDSSSSFSCFQESFASFPSSYYVLVCCFL